MRIEHAFVVVKKSNMEHNRGQLFYSVCRTDADGVLWNVLDPMQYPFYWGFSKIEHAFAIADEYNEGLSVDRIAERFSEEERAA
jgi:hypothetical protein